MARSANEHQSVSERGAYRSAGSDDQSEREKYISHGPHLTDTPTSSFRWRQCDTSDLNASISNLRRSTKIATGARSTTHTTCKILTKPVKAKNHGLVSSSILFTSSSSPPAPLPCCFIASSKPCVIDEKIWNLKYDNGWNVISNGTIGVVVLISVR